MIAVHIKFKPTGDYKRSAMNKQEFMTYHGYIFATAVLTENTNMKTISAFIICVSTLLLYSCDPAATFDQPQPADIKSLAAFPEHLQGKYLAADQASTITITDFQITRYYDFDYAGHKDSLGSSYQVIGDTLIDLTNHSKEQVQVIGDTIIQHYRETDTLFNISSANVLKKFKGYYFLNNRYDSTAWEVKKLGLQKGILTIGSIADTTDVQKLKTISATTADTTPVHFALTRRQFKKFAQQAGFAEQEMFTRVAE